jgi:hypothetical protein
MALNPSRPKNKPKKAIQRSNTMNCGQILSADQVYQYGGVLKTYGIDKLNFSFSQEKEGFLIRMKDTPKTWTEQVTQKYAAAPVRKLYKNSPHYQATIEEFSVGKGADSYIDKFLRVQLNPSKILHPYNLTTSIAALSDMFIGLQKDLRNDSIEIDFEKATLNRLDIANNMTLSEDVVNYFPVMDTFQGKRQMKKQHDLTRYWANSENGFVIYPKNRELEKKIKESQMPDKQITRAEMKLLTSGCIERNIGTKFLNGIDSDELFVETYNEYVKKQIFREDQYKQTKIDFGQEYQIYEALYQKYGNKAFDYYTKSNGIIHLANISGGIENLIIMIEKYHNPRTARRRKAEINQLLDIYEKQFRYTTIDFIRRMNELKDKMIIKKWAA